jgi:Flp pilus assembly protein TadG
MISRARAVQRLQRRCSIRRRNDRQGGAVALEAALLTPLLLLITFGIIEFGMLFKDWLAVVSAVRAGTRIASAEPRFSTFAQDAADDVAKEGTALDMSNVQELWIYKAEDSGTYSGYPVGATDKDFTSCTQCVKFHWDSSSQAFVPYSTTWTATEQNACQGDPSKDSIGVYLQIKHAAVTGLIFDNLTIDEHSVMSLEPIPMSRVCK